MSYNSFWLFPNERDEDPVQITIIQIDLLQRKVLTKPRMFNIRITTKFQSNCPFRITNNPETLFKIHKISFNVFLVKHIERRLDIRLQVSSTSNVTGPAVKTTSKGVGKAKRDWNAANSKAFKHLWKKEFIL